MKRRTLLERWSGFVVFNGPYECWGWTASTQPGGYGQLTVKTPRGYRIERAHRYSYERFVKPIPPGLHVLHTCDNPPCCNPAHLFLGTQADNNRDMAAKGRASRIRRGITIVNAASTHCPKGHPTTGEHERRRSKGGRYCGQCNAERARAWRERRSSE